MSPAIVELGREEAARFLVHHLGLARDERRRGAPGVRAVLGALRSIQLDPLDPMGTNADLVALARVPGLAAGEVYTHALGGHGFEHFAKERCLLPAEAFPYYRDRAVETPWWRTTERAARIEPALLDDVLSEVRERGPIAASDLSPRGSVRPLDWSGWKGTSSAATMALEMLWTRCAVVVADRLGPGGKKRYDVPARALPRVHDAPAPEPFHRWALGERTRAAGLLRVASSPSWSMLRDADRGALVREAVEAGTVAEVRIEGAPRPFLAPPEVAGAARARAVPDDRMRILGPLDALLWDRALVRHLFGFDYVWEVYKPAATRRWGWYVCPLLHRGRLVGRLEGRLERRGGGGERVLAIERVWREAKHFDEDALDAAISRHAESCGATRVRRAPRARRR